MGGLLQCCVSPTHLTCCSVLSLLGAIFYVSRREMQIVFYFTITYQARFISFEVNKPEETRWSCLAAAVVRQHSFSSTSVGQSVQCYAQFVDRGAWQCQPIHATTNSWRSNQHLSQKKPRLTEATISWRKNDSRPNNFEDFGLILRSSSTLRVFYRATHPLPADTISQRFWMLVSRSLISELYK
jgi:hypothetical protein